MASAALDHWLRKNPRGIVGYFRWVPENGRDDLTIDEAFEATFCLPVRLAAASRIRIVATSTDLVTASQTRTASPDTATSDSLWTEFFWSSPKSNFDLSKLLVPFHCQSRHTVLDLGTNRSAWFDRLARMCSKVVMLLPSHLNEGEQLERLSESSKKRLSYDVERDTLSIIDRGVDVLGFAYIGSTGQYNVLANDSSSQRFRKAG